MRRNRTYLGGGMIVVGVAMMLLVPIFFWQSHAGAKALLKAAPAPIHIVLSQQQGVLFPAPAKTIALPMVGAPIGSLSIDSIDLQAPIVEGTSDWQLRDGVGHLGATPLPGEMGVSILAGHNVTFFHEIGQLQAGDLIRVKTAQGIFVYSVFKHQILHVGDTLPNAHLPELALETCYPFNDWNLTPFRYMVEAVLVKSALA